MPTSNNSSCCSCVYAFIDSRQQVDHVTHVAITAAVHRVRGGYGGGNKRNKGLQKEKSLCDKATRSKIEAWMSKAAPPPETTNHFDRDILSRVSEASGVSTWTLQTHLSAIEKIDAKSSLEN